MTKDDIEAAWNAQADNNNTWATLDADERVEFTIKYIEQEAREALDTLGRSIYTEKVAMTPAHAINHVKQVFSVPSNERLENLNGNETA